ncbi:hypothetical protein [Tessaracoccus defluvii]|uniref:hypothetical protein n=1 Tax=Tessaracoccus defluvii TaxID=1285901 RepID=UPI0031D91C3B
MRLTSPTVRLVAAAFTVVGMAAALAGCSPDTAAPGAGDPGQDPPAAGSTPTVEPSPAVESPAAVETAVRSTTAPPAAAGPDCLVGSWEMRNDSFEATLSALLLDDPDFPTEMLGSAGITLTGDTFIRFGTAGEYGGWQDGFTMAMGSGAETVRHTQTSADVAQYSADADHVYISEYQRLYAEAEMQIGDLATVSLPANDSSTANVSIFGHTAEVPVGAPEQPDATARYTCGGDTLTIQADGFPSATEFTRIADITRE